MRTEITGAKCLVMKIGSSSLTDRERHPDPARIETLAAELASLQTHDKRLVLAASGAITAVLGPLGFPARPKDLETQQAAAAIGQGILIRRYAEAFAAHHQMVAQVLLTASGLQDGHSYRNALNTTLRLFRLGVIPVINENDTVATGEIRFGDNDRLAALTARLVRTDALVVLSDVGGLYTAHPAEPGARLTPRVHDFTELVADTSRVGSRVGTGGMHTKVETARVTTSGGVSVVLAHADQLLATLEGEEVGTLFEATGRRRPRRLLWLVHTAEMSGELRIDAGAARVVGKEHASLLAVGIDDITGDFGAGDPVDITGPGGALLARGLVDCSATELRRWMGLGGLAVHRDLMIEIHWSADPLIHQSTGSLASIPVYRVC